MSFDFRTSIFDRRSKFEARSSKVPVPHRMPSAPLSWRLPDRALVIDRRPLVMGIINVTPDSFSDGGACVQTEAAVQHGLALASQGADLLDIGGESSRPGARPVPVDVEIGRVLPVVQRLAAQVKIPLSVDTYKAPVARACLDAGALIVNDITALTGDAAMAEVVRSTQAGAILMHMQGTPATMQENPHYDDVVADIAAYFEARLHDLGQLGIAKEQLVLDPGIGFGKARSHNLELLAHLDRFQQFHRPVCLGVSRKGFLGSILQRPIHRRLAGSLAALAFAFGREAVQIVRVHDVEETHDFTMVYALLGRISATRPQPNNVEFRNRT
jgi:dihydropteroate synthase